MFDMSSLMTRILLRKQTDADGNPTDDGLISISRLHQFMRPIFFRKKNERGFDIRLEWLGYFVEASGDKVFVTERELLHRVLKHFRDDSKQFTLHNNIRPSAFVAYAAAVFT